MKRTKLTEITPAGRLLPVDELRSVTGGMKKVSTATLSIDGSVDEATDELSGA
jgi:hypothetical protein